MLFEVFIERKGTRASQNIKGWNTTVFDSKERSLDILASLRQLALLNFDPDGLRHHHNVLKQHTDDQNLLTDYCELYITQESVSDSPEMDDSATISKQNP